MFTPSGSGTPSNGDANISEFATGCTRPMSPFPTTPGGGGGGGSFVCSLVLLQAESASSPMPAVAAVRTTSLIRVPPLVATDILSPRDILERPVHAARNHLEHS